MMLPCKNPGKLCNGCGDCKNQTGPRCNYCDNLLQQGQAYLVCYPDLYYCADCLSELELPTLLALLGWQLEIL